MYMQNQGLPRWLNGKDSTCSAGDLGSIPGLGSFPGEGNGKPLQDSYLESSVERSVASYSSWGCRLLDMTEVTGHSLTFGYLL